MDVTINNLLATANTKLIRDYCAIDPRLKQLIFLVKHWAKQRAVNDCYRGTLSSYAYVLLCIHTLQTRSPPVLPVLQARANGNHPAFVLYMRCAVHPTLQMRSPPALPVLQARANASYGF